MSNILDAMDLEEGVPLECDLCIVGAGAAGITMAVELIEANSHLKVIMLESGSFDANSSIQKMYRGHVSGLMPGVAPQFLTESRHREFGGSTNCWGGWCRPLDGFDFEFRKDVHDIPWPIGRDDLNDGYETAQKMCRLGPGRYDDVDFWTEGRDLESFKAETDGLMRSGIWQYIGKSEWLRFGKTYRGNLEKPGIDLWTYRHANVLDLDTNPQASYVTRARCRAFDGDNLGPRFWVRAKQFVMALGGIETVRLLLLSDKYSPAGLGNNRNRDLGRHFMVHPLVTRAATAVFRRRRVSPLQGNFYRDETVIRMDDARGLTVVGAIPGRPEPGPMVTDIATIDEADFARENDGTIFRIRGALLPTKRAVDANIKLGNFRVLLDGLSPDSEVANVNMNWEQVPRGGSEIKLSRSQREGAFNQLVVDLNWQLTDKDKDTFREGLNLLDGYLRRIGYDGLTNRIDPDDWPTGSLGAGDHHMGATRMSADADKGIVDRNCKVHSVDNLSIASSSVFTTGGVANATLTIIALAARLAHHLNKTLSE